MEAPYQIMLHDGRLIFAPQDNDAVIRLRPPPALDAPSSPTIDYTEYASDEFDDDDLAMMEEEAYNARGGAGGAGMSSSIGKFK
jgi:hypothetical protein